MEEKRHPYQNAIDKINEIGLYTATKRKKPYRLLHMLARSLNVYMHGSQAFIGSTFKIPRPKMKKMASTALKLYCETGVLQIPDLFKFNDRRQYRHDGDALANRNTWDESNNAKGDINRREPVTYMYNSTKK